MKYYLKLTLLLSLLFIATSCKENTSKQDKKEISEQHKTKQEIEILEDTITRKETLFKKTQPLNKRIRYMHVTAASGLNYRASPNGKVLGKFAWRDKVEFLFDTNYKQKIIDNYQEIESNWAAVKHKEDTVFVFNHYNFISYQEPRVSRIKLYTAEAYYKDTLRPSNQLDIRQAFVNVSESFYMPEKFIDKKDLRKDSIIFNKKQRTEFLKRMNYSNRDTIFIYDLTTGLVEKNPIKETPIAAFINIYSQVKDEYKTNDYDQWEYQIGFNLGKANYGGFAAIGKENPFIEKGLQPVLFEEMTEDTIDNYIETNLIPKDWKKGYTPKTYYVYKYDNIRSFVKISKGTNNNYRSYWSDLLVKNVNTKESYSVYQSEGESSSRADLNLKENDILPSQTYHYQYIGKLFKNQPPVTFGYMWESFGCPLIHFLDKEKLPVIILCDNRH